MSFKSIGFLPKNNTFYFVPGDVTNVYFLRELGSALCIFDHAKGIEKPISHAVLPVSPKRNGESLNKFNIMRQKKSSLDKDIFGIPHS